VDFRKACGKVCVPCLLGNARNKPHSASKPNAKHIPHEQQQRNFEEEYAASRKGNSMSKSALNFMHEHGGCQPSRDLPPLAYQSIDECTDMRPVQRGPNGSTDIRHVLISTCEVTGYRQTHGLADLTKESLQDALGKTIASAKVHGYELYACKFDPSGQASAKEVQSFLDQQCIHHETTAPGTKQEMPVAEKSNATFSQGARANLAGAQATSQDGGGRDKKWRDALF
jgi:hypothetical protein